MKNKPLWRISVSTSREAEDAVAELLASTLGNPPSVYFNAETGASIVSVFSPKSFPLETRKKISAGLKRIEDCGLKIDSGKIKIGKIRREDWAESWKRHFKPMEIGGSLLVKPSWSRKRPGKNQAVVVLDPGLSFGTGRHPTTEFCLREIVRRRKIEVSQSFLDIGTGSGILAIAAAKLAYKAIHAIDFDLEAVRIARANAKANRVSRGIEIVRGDVTKLPEKPEKRFDLICANLISDLLVAERKKIAAQLNRNGILVLAGILKSEFSEVQRAFEKSGMKLVSAKTEKEWRSGSFCF
jgi:ribosomal protein L11 methyltransferase